MFEKTPQRVLEVLLKAVLKGSEKKLWNAPNRVLTNPKKSPNDSNTSKESSKTPKRRP